MAREIRIAMAGVGNCASSLIQGISYYSGKQNSECVGLLHPELCGYRAEDILPVAAFDIDARKVGKKIKEAMFAAPNNTKIFCEDVPDYNVIIEMGRILDSFPEHMMNYPENQRFILSNKREHSLGDVVKILKDSKSDILLNYLPVGSQKSVEFYAEACLRSGVSLINCMPVFIVSDSGWGERFREKNIPCVGDDIKAQVGATIVHRVLTRMMYERGAKIDATYQLNTGGNTDFLNMLDRKRLGSKKVSKTEAVQSQLGIPLPADQIHIGPSDYIPWQKDNKICFCRIEGRGFGSVPFNLELRLSVEDSPNSGGESIDAIRAVKIARDKGIGGPLHSVSAFTMKHPPKQMTDYEAGKAFEEFINSAKS